MHELKIQLCLLRFNTAVNDLGVSCERQRRLKYVMWWVVVLWKLADSWTTSDSWLLFFLSVQISCAKCTQSCQCRSSWPQRCLLCLCSASPSKTSYIQGEGTSFRSLSLRLYGALHRLTNAVSRSRFCFHSPSLVLLCAVGSLFLIIALAVYRHQHPINLYLLLGFVSRAFSFTFPFCIHV